MEVQLVTFAQREGCPFVEERVEKEVSAFVRHGYVALPRGGVDPDAEPHGFSIGP
jgi:hypothetical protein